MRNVDAAEPGVAHPVLFQNPGFQIKISEHVVGDEADGEQNHQNPDQFQTPLLHQWVDVGVPCKNHTNVPITQKVDKKWDGESCDSPRDAVGQIFTDPLVRCGVKTRVWFGDIILFKEQIGEDLSNDQEPDGDAYGQGESPGDLPHHLHRVDYAQVPVDADACEEADAAVEVEVEAEAGQLAERLAVLPPALARIVIHEERQGEHVQQVRHPEVQHEDVDMSDVVPAVANAPQTPYVG